MRAHHAFRRHATAKEAGSLQQLRAMREAVPAISPAHSVSALKIHSQRALSAEKRVKLVLMAQVQFISWERALMSIQTVVSPIPSIDLCKTNVSKAGKSMCTTFLKGQPHCW